MKKYLLETIMLNYKDKTIHELIRKKRWDKLSDFEKIKQIYMFIRDDIKFGYNVDDNIPASKVLIDYYGQCNTSFCGFGVAIDNFKNPVIDWNENDTYIQKNGINKDFGVYNSPDNFYSEHSQNLNKVKLFLYRNCVRHLMNKKVNSIRNK